MQRPTSFEAPISISNSDLSRATFLHAVGFENVELLKVDLSGAIDPQGRPLR